MKNIIRKILLEDAFLDNISKIDKVITVNHSDEIYKLLLGMFPNAKEIIDYQYNDELGQPFAEWRRVIYEINNYVLMGPKIIDSKKIELDTETIADRQKKYNQYIKDKKAGKPAKYFRDNDTDPRNIDYTKLPPITVLEKGGTYELMDGAHRTFLAKMNNKPLKAYIWKKQNNKHPNVAKIKTLFNNINEDFNPEDFSWVNTELEPIRDDKHRYSLISDTISKVKEYKGWKIHQDKFDGVVYWYGEGNYTGMATPEWSEEFKIPVDITWGPDEYDNLTEIDTPHFRYVVEVEDWYSKDYFEKVYQALTDYINRVG